MQLPGFYGPIDACACSGYQALLPHREGPGEEASSQIAGLGLVLWLGYSYCVFEVCLI